MNLFVTVAGTIFALISTMVMAYISIVTGIGPWIAPALVIISTVLLKMRRKKKEPGVEEGEIALAQTVGSVGGIIAVAIGFTLPTLYFLDQKLFDSWLARPFYFCGLIGATVFTAGALGMFLAKRFGEKLVYREKLKFPVSLLIHRMIALRSQGGKVRDMVVGFLGTGAFCFLRDGLFAVKGMLPKIIYVAPGILGKELAFTLATGPTLWSVGFITGSVIAIPLLVGMVSKYVVLYPLNYHSVYLPFSLFGVQKPATFILAFCSGLVLTEAVLGMTKYPKIVWGAIKDHVNVEKIKKFIGNNFMSGIAPTETTSERSGTVAKLQSNIRPILEFSLVLAMSFGFFTYLNFPVAAQVFIIVLTMIATYQISVMGAAIGLVPFGRFATFVMIPTMLLFKLDYVQITFLCVFVNVSSAVASDLLFDYKVGELCQVGFKRIRKYQWLGLVVTALSMGFMLWVLFTNFKIGSPELFAYRAKTRAILIQSLSHGFNYWILLLGGLYGYVLKKIKVSPALVLGGILMPNHLSLGLIMGGLASKFFKKPDDYFSLCSGIFASESIWILITMLLKFGGAR